MTNLVHQTQQYQDSHHTTQARLARFQLAKTTSNKHPSCAREDISFHRLIILKRLIYMNSQDQGFTQRNLPLDILGQIFDTYTDSSRRDHSDFSNAAIPWILGQICRSWRQVALSFPRCWNVFTLEVTDENVDEPSPMHQELLKRSGSTALQISFHFSRLTTLVLPTPFRILEPAISHSPQWEIILIQGMDVTEIQRQFGPAQGQLSLLRSLKIYFRSKISRPNTAFRRERQTTRFDLFNIAPSLTEVLLNDISGSLEKYEICLPWSQLTRYVTYGFAKGVFPTELERQPNLEVLICVHNHFPTLPSKYISHHRLRELYLYATTDIQACFERLGEITLPALEALAVTFMTVELRCNVSAIPSIVALVSRSRCQLKALVIQQNSEFHADLLPDLLSQIPSLETLDIGHCAHFRSTLSALCFDVTQPVLLPNLQRLVVACNNTTRPSDIRLISDLVQSRQHASEENNVLGLPFVPLLYARIFIKKTETRYYAFLDLEGWQETPQADSPQRDVYRYDVSAPNFEAEMTAALNDVRQILDANAEPPPSKAAEIAAKYRAMTIMYYARTLCSIGTNLNKKEQVVAESLRTLCHTYIPPSYLDGRRWIMAQPSNILYIHPQHSIRKSIRKSDIVMGIDYPGKFPPEGYHYWLGEHMDRLLENLRPFIF